MVNLIRFSHTLRKGNKCDDMLANFDNFGEWGMIILEDELVWQLVISGYRLADCISLFD